MARSKNPAHIESDAAAAKVRQAVGDLGTVLPPSAAEEPILAPSVRAAVHEWMVEINAAADLQAAGIKPRSTCLLYGPPGTGKTTLAHHLAARLNIPMVSVGAENLVSKYLGESGKNVAALFNGVKAADTRCLVFVDEIDAIGSNRENNNFGGADNERNATMSVLLRHIEQFDGLFISATNLKDSIDPALWRRFGMQISVDIPDLDARFAIIKRYLTPFEWEDDAIEQLALDTEGASPSLLRQLCEGMKRALVLGGRLRRPVDSAAAVLRPIIGAIAVHPSYTKPPLWETPEKILGRFGVYAWPPERKEAA